MDMDFEETELTTDRLILKRAHADRHAAEINATVCDSIDSLRPWLPWAKDIPSVEDTRVGLHRVTGDCKSYTFRVYLQKEPKLIGMCGIVYVSQQQQQQQFKKSAAENFKTYEVGYWIHKDYTKKGFISEAVCKIMNFGVDILRADMFILKCDERNIPSNKIAEKFGFTFVKKEQETLPERPDWGENTLIHYQRIVTTP